MHFTVFKCETLIYLGGCQIELLFELLISLPDKNKMLVIGHNLFYLYKMKSTVHFTVFIVKRKMPDPDWLILFVSWEPIKDD